MKKKEPMIWVAFRKGKPIMSAWNKSTLEMAFHVLGELKTGNISFEEVSTAKEREMFDPRTT